MFRREGETYHWAASFGHSSENHERIKTHLLTRRLSPGRGSVVGRAVLECRPVQIADVLADPDYEETESQKLAQFRTTFAAPLLREGVPIGAIALQRTEVKPFTEKQIELVQTFADQAVIAMENVRLFDEVQARTDDLAESLQQQTATADILKVISRSAFDLQPVFDSMAESVVRLCEAERAYIFRFDGKMLRAVASHNAGPENQDWVYRNPIPLGRHSVSARAGLERRTVQVADIQNDPEYSYVAHDVDPIRTTLAVPMLKGDELIGTITIYRLEVKPFTAKQISLMETFADQAVIAIENVRLFDEVQKRTADLTEALEQQTATSEILKSALEFAWRSRPGIRVMLENAVRLCDAKFGTHVPVRGKAVPSRSEAERAAALVEFLDNRGPFVPDAANALDRSRWRSKTVLRRTAEAATSHAAHIQARRPSLGSARTHPRRSDAQGR